MSDWQPESYNRFRELRKEPVDFILSRLPVGLSERILDLGCGTGENTVELLRRAPKGRALGVDSSIAMIERANQMRRELPPDLVGRLQFRSLDMRALDHRGEYSLVFSNAALHWIDDQRLVLAACFQALLPNGRLVVQMPANHQERAQLTLVQLAADEPWRQWLEGAALPSNSVGSPAHYKRMLHGLGFIEVDCSYHTFNHRMASAAEVMEFMRSTTLRPFMERLPGEMHERFTTELTRRLEQAYATSGPLMFPFRRLFLWAKRPPR